MPTQKGFTTLVIGAGAAGLNAARILREQGRRVMVLEARNRLGGRMHSHLDAETGEPIELGAEMVHGLPLEAQALLDVGRDLIERDGEYVVARDGKIQVDPTYFARLREILDRLPLNLAIDYPFSEFLRKQPGESADLYRAEKYVEGYHAADVDQISTQSLAQIESEAKDLHTIDGAYLIRGGYPTLIERLAASLGESVRLNFVAKRIHWQRGQVEVHESSGGAAPLRAQSVLITVPIGVLQAQPGVDRGALDFDPPLPDTHQGAIKKIASGVAIKVVFKFKSAFWEEIADLPEWALLFDSDPGTSLRVWWPRGRLLIGWVGGPPCQVWSDLSPTALKREGVKAIARIFGRSIAEIESLYEGAWVHDWSRDPFARGVYNYARVGGADAARDLAQPVQKTLYFAGEATQGGGYSGTVNGALMSGARAAQEILANHP